VALKRGRAIAAIEEAIEEIESYFEMVGFGAEGLGGADQIAQNGDSDSEEDDGSLEESTFDREEIEVAIDVFVSRLAENGIVPKPTLRDRPSLLWVLERFFPPKHRILERARSFEADIKGYFDVVSYDAMARASSELAEIRDILKGEAKANG